jgi:hypothetical protein
MMKETAMTKATKKTKVTKKTTATTKRFLVFAGDNHYPGGGWEDFKGSAGTKQAATKLLLSLRGWEWAHVVNIKTGEIVEELYDRCLVK